MKVAAAVGSLSVVVGGVLGQDGAQMPFAEDQYLVGGLGLDGSDEPFRVGVRLGARGGILTVVMPASARTGSKEVVNCPARSRTRNRKSAARSPRSRRRFRACGVVHGPSGWAVTPRTWTVRVPTSRTKKQYNRRSVTAQSTWKKSTASIVEAGVRRNCRQVVSVCRLGAGGNPRDVRTRRIVDALTRWPSLRSSPWIRWYPHVAFSVANRSMRVTISALTEGRPLRRE